ncbi:DNA mismatch repair protein [Blomia tropicalis]|nr:DNA mismatch repair protein [Blomia tropicalis]
MECNETKLNSIQKLNQEVINKICAGEVIHRPLNVVKELIENSLDAGATNIVVTLKNGGMSFISIQDNGIGIKKEDLEIVCQRFTTSKFNSFDDFKTLTTFGFRGEALASISTISHLSIVTKTADNVCGYKAEYVNGTLKPNSSITSIAANNGTTITVENLFYNMPTRKSALKSELTEFALVQEMITKYSILHSQTCSFILKKFGDNSHAVNTNIKNNILVNVDNLYSKKISPHMIPIMMDNEKLGFRIKGYFSNGDLNLSKVHFLLFINNRLVDCSILKKCLCEMYMHYLMKGGHPFILLVLKIDPRNIDVNIHPTKSEVCFLYQNQILDLILKYIEDHLKNKEFVEVPDQTSNSKSNNKTITSENRRSSLDKEQMVFQKNADGKLVYSSSSKLIQDGKRRESTESNHSGKKSIVRPSHQVRTDSQMQRIDHYINRKKTNTNRRYLKLRSLTELRSEIVNSSDEELLNMITKSTYVGCADENFFLLQKELDLFLVNIHNMNEELFYQIIMADFANFDYIKFGNPLSLFKLLNTYLQVNGLNYGNNMDEQTTNMVKILLSNREMMDDYFSIKISPGGSLEAIPCLVDKHRPQISFLPDFIYKLVHNVDWEDEKNCFHNLAIELSRFYSRKAVKLLSEQHYSTFEQQLEQKFYPLYRTLLCPSKKLYNNSTFQKVANISDLYKVFERC